MNALVQGLARAVHLLHRALALVALLGQACVGSPVLAADWPVLGAAQVAVRFTGFTYARATGTYNTVATLSNVSQTTYSGRLRLVLTSLLPEAAVLANASGVSSDGKPYLEIVLPAAGFAPGSVANATLAFRNPSTGALRFTHRIEGVPQGFPALITLSLGAPASAPGQEVELQWVTAGEVPTGAALQLRARASVVDTASTPLTTIWYRTASGAWSATPEALQTQPGAGRLRVVLPSRALGPWRLEARLVDAAGALLASAGGSLLVAAQPTARLALSRALANSAEPIRADVTLAAGVAPQTVRLMAWLVRPDGSTVGLPGLERNRLEVYRGLAKNSRFTLLDRAFAASEQGSYRVHVGLYDGDGRALGQDSAALRVCDTPAVVTGVVREPSGQAFAPGAALDASVGVVDLANGLISGVAPVSSDGRFTLNARPGRYALVARAFVDNMERSGFGNAFEVGCLGQPLSQNVTLGAP